MNMKDTVLQILKHYGASKKELNSWEKSFDDPYYEWTDEEVDDFVITEDVGIEVIDPKTNEIYVLVITVKDVGDFKINKKGEVKFWDSTKNACGGFDDDDCLVNDPIIMEYDDLKDLFYKIKHHEYDDDYYSISDYWKNNY